MRRLDRAGTGGQRIAGAVLAGLLLLLLVAAGTNHRESWPSFVGDEATYLMAAESLAWDFDLTYDQGDFVRFESHWQREPEGLILQSGDHGKTLVYSKPFFYPAFIAPFVRWAPRHGAMIANVLLLAAAAFATQRAIKTRVGPLAALWIALFIFGSVAFAYAYWAHADLFLLCLTAIGLSLVDSAPDRSTQGLWRWIVSGALLAIVGFSRPIYLPLLAAAALAAEPGRRRRQWAALALGAALLIGGSLAAHRLLADSWSSYDGERSGFYGRTGFPDIQFSRTDWDSFLQKWGNSAWNRSDVELETGEPRLWMWDAAYFLIGRHVGILAYFLPLGLGLVGGRWNTRRWGLLAAVALSVAGTLFLRPFNFYGGGAAIGNRYFLPIYPAFWLMAARPLRARWLVLTALLAAPILWPLWAAPGAYFLNSDNSYRFTSPVARAVLPYETTLSHLKPSGQEDLILGGLWIKLLDPQVRSIGGEHLELATGRRGSVLIGSRRPLDAVVLTVPSDAELTLVVGGRPVPPLAAQVSGRQAFEIRLGSPRARHPMWWSAEEFNLYVLDLGFRGPSAVSVPFTLSRSASAGADSGAIEATRRRSPLLWGEPS